MRLRAQIRMPGLLSTFSGSGFTLQGTGFTFEGSRWLVARRWYVAFGAGYSAGFYPGEYL
jgi:hypothetical protein